MTEVARLKRFALMLAVPGLAASVLAFLMHRSNFFVSYLETYLFLLGITLGCLAMLLLHGLVGGRWGRLIQPHLSAAMKTLPLMTVLFLPILFGMQDLYMWTRPGVVAHDHILHEKEAYLNVPGFLIRAAVSFACWLGLMLLMRKPRPRTETHPIEKVRSHKRWSAIGLCVYGMTMSFCAFDWVMSIDPYWFSSIFGGQVMAGQMLSAFAFCCLMLYLIDGPQNPLSVPGTLNDVGNLLMMSVMFWTYVSFSQFLIIWSGRIPEEVGWYYERWHSPWDVIAVALIIFHFALPFLILLNRPVKRNVKTLGLVALWLLGMRMVDFGWVIRPSFHGQIPMAHWSCLATFTGLGGLWLYLYAHLLVPHAQAAVSTPAPTPTPPAAPPPQDRNEVKHER